MLYGGIGLVALATLAMSAANAQKPTAERELLGVRVMQTWKMVLNRHGQPTRIETGAPVATIGGQQSSTVSGGMSGGLPSMGGMGPMSGMPPMPPTGMGSGAPMGMMGSSGMSAMMGARPGMTGPGSMGMMMPPGGPMGMMGSGGVPTTEEGAGSYPGGGMVMGGKMGSMMGGGMMGATNAQAQASGEGEVTWIYDHGQNTYVFLFNKDGRVIQVQSFGYANGGKTAAGIALGDPVAKIYRTYGWPDQIEKEGDSMVLDYSRASHVAFQLLDRHNGKGSRVVGITVALTEPRNPAGILHMVGLRGQSTGATGGAGMMGPSAPMGMMGRPSGGPMMGGVMPGMTMPGMRGGMGGGMSSGMSMPMGGMTGGMGKKMMGLGGDTGK
jgi:hypothetical protein